MIKRGYLLISVVLGVAAPASAQAAGADTPAPTTVAPQSEANPGAPAPLTVYFDEGSSAIRGMDQTVLDKASRAYSEGKPIVMILTGSADRTGQPESNLVLSQLRATAVLNGLISRGIPAERFQVLAKGETDLPFRLTVAWLSRKIAGSTSVGGEA